MSDSSTDDVLIGELAEEFVERLRKGERADWAEYAQRYPHLANEVRKLFPALIVMEQTRPTRAELSDAASGNRLRGTNGEKLERLGEFRVLREVGRGGMGVVYEAEQESLGRRVALKVLPIHAMLEPRHAQRFDREARAAARLHHTNIVPVFGVGRQDGLHYYVMQFILGTGLDQVLDELKNLRKADRQASTVDRNRAANGQRRENPSDRIDRPGRSLSGTAARAAEALISGSFSTAVGVLEPTDLKHVSSDVSLRVGLSSDVSSSNGSVPPVSHTTLSEAGRQYWQGVARIGAQVADALAYANSQGVLHRDIKPANLLLDTQGMVWVTDFGLAKTTDDDNLTHTGDIVGTLRYLAPERLRGESDERSDIYSLGITLYELMTLRPAFEEQDRTRLIQQIAKEEPPRPGLLDPQAPLDLETIVLKAIAKEPADRYCTAADFASDLRRFLEDRPIQARRASLVERSWRFCRRNPVVAGLTASLAVLVVVLGVGLAIGHLLRSERDQAVVSEARAKHAEAEARGLLDRAVNAEHEVTIRSHLAHAVAYRRGGQPGRRQECLSELAKAMALHPSPELHAELRDEAIACLTLVDLVAVDAPLVEARSGLVFDGDYRQYAFADDEAKIHIRRVGQPADVRLLPGIGDRNVVRFSPRGRYIASWPAAGGRTQLWQVESARPVFSEPLQAFTACVSPDNRRVALSMLDGSAAVYELPSGREIDRLPTGAVPIAIAFHPHGRRLAVALSRPPKVYIWDLDQKEVVEELDDVQAPIHAVAWDSDGRQLGLGLATPANCAEIWNPATRQRIATLTGHLQDVIACEFHPSGDFVVTRSWDGTTAVWESSTARSLVVWQGGVAGAVSHDGCVLGHFWKSDRNQFVELIANREYQTLVSSLGAGKGEYRDGSISPDGKMLALGMDDGARIWDLLSSRQIAYLPIEQTQSLTFSPDGRELITCGLSGLLRWPLTASPPSRQNRGEIDDNSANISERTDSDVIHIGPPRAVELPFAPKHARSAPDGRTLGIASAQADESLVMDQTTERIRARIKARSYVDRVSVSADGRWAATTGWHAATLCVWDAHTAELAHEFSMPLASAFFSPDSKHLITSRPEEFCFWEVGTWRKTRTFPRDHCPYPGTVAYSPDGRVMALELSSAIICLVDVETGQTLARLEDPHHDRPHWMSFTPDGTRFVEASNFAKTIHVWDLRSIREQLATMGLDWDPSPIPLRNPIAAVQPPQVSVDLGELGLRAEASQKLKQAKTHSDLAEAHLQSKRWPEAVAALKLAVELSPDNATYQNALAWLLADCADPSYRDATLAVAHSRRAVELAPDAPEAWNTLGVAHYRTGEWRSAIDALTKAEQIQPGVYFGQNAFFLAMAHWRLAEQDVARKWLERAVEWMNANEQSPQHREELDRFRAEAAELLQK